MDKMKKFVDSLDLEELSSREEFVEMASVQEVEQNEIFVQFGAGERQKMAVTTVAG